MIKILSNEKNLIFLIGLFPLIFITGPFLTDSFVIVLDIFFIIFFLREAKEKKIFFFNYFKFEIFSLLLFWILSIVSSLNSENISTSFLKSLLHIRFYIFLLSIIFFANKFLNNFIIKKYFYLLLSSILIITSLSMIIEVIVKFLFHLDIISFTFKTYQTSRYSGLFFEELIIGSFLSKILIIYMVLIFNKKNFNKFDYFTIFLGTITIFLSGERIAFITFGMFLIIYSVLSRNKINLKLYAILFFLTVSTIIASLAFNEEMNSRYNKFFIFLKDNMTNQTNTNKLISSYNYFDLFSSAINVWEKNKSFGVGVRNYREKCKEIYNQKGLSTDKFCSTHPHNYYLEILAETGFYGLLSFVIFLLIVITKTSISKKLDKNNKLLTIFLFVLIFWPAASTGSYFNNYNSGILWYLIAFIMYNKFINDNSIKL